MQHKNKYAPKDSLCHFGRDICLRKKIRALTIFIKNLISALRNNAK